MSPDILQRFMKHPRLIMKNYLLILSLLLFAAVADAEDQIRTLLPFDAIPAITEPQFVSADEAKLAPDTPVIGVAINGESRAYSLYLLNGHEIVNDSVGGEKIATTW